MEALLFIVGYLLVFALVYTAVWACFIPSAKRSGRASAQFYYNLYWVNFPTVREFYGEKLNNENYVAGYESASFGIWNGAYKRAWAAEAERLGKPVTK